MTGSTGVGTIDDSWPSRSLADYNSYGNLRPRWHNQTSRKTTQAQKKSG
jgi:hypothetical protein